jgi:Ca2+-binding EF-hand superfamily protein
MAFERIGNKKTDEEIKEIFHEHDIKNKGELDFEDFKHILVPEDREL